VWTNIGIACVMMILTTAIHAAFMMLAIALLRAHDRGGRREAASRPLLFIGTSVVLMFAASVVEVAAWAGALVLLGALSSFEQALYFSTVSFTTLGYGDVVLDPRWRILGPFEAANGIMMFGWSTAIVVAAVQRVYFPRRG